MSGFGYGSEIQEEDRPSEPNKILLALFVPIFAALTFILSVLARIERFGKTLLATILRAFSVLMIGIILLPVVVFGYDKKHRKLVDMVLPIYLATVGLFFFLYIALFC